jgi:hypothetical protein
MAVNSNEERLGQWNQPSSSESCWIKENSLWINIPLKNRPFSILGQQFTYSSKSPDSSESERQILEIPSGRASTKSPFIRIKILRLYDDALCQNFARNLVFLRQKKPMVGQLTEIQLPTTRRQLRDRCLQKSPQRRIARYNSWIKRRPVPRYAMKWHSHLGHQDALVNYSAYVQMHGSTTVDCDAYDESQIKYRIYRTPRDLHEDPR